MVPSYCSMCRSVMRRDDFPLQLVLARCHILKKVGKNAYLPERPTTPTLKPGSMTVLTFRRTVGVLGFDELHRLAIHASLSCR